MKFVLLFLFVFGFINRINANTILKIVQSDNQAKLVINENDQSIKGLQFDYYYLCNGEANGGMFGNHIKNNVGYIDESIGLHTESSFQLSTYPNINQGFLNNRAILFTLSDDFIPQSQSTDDDITLIVWNMIDDKCMLKINDFIASSENSNKLEVQVITEENVLLSNIYDGTHYDNCFEYQSKILCCDTTSIHSWCVWGCDAPLSEAFRPDTCYGHSYPGCCYYCTAQDSCTEVVDGPVVDVTVTYSSNCSDDSEGTTNDCHCSSDIPNNGAIFKECVQSGNGFCADPNFQCPSSEDESSIDSEFEDDDVVQLDIEYEFYSSITQFEFEIDTTKAIIASFNKPNGEIGSGSVFGGAFSNTNFLTAVSPQQGKIIGYSPSPSSRAISAGSGTLVHVDVYKLTAEGDVCIENPILYKGNQIQVDAVVDNCLTIKETHSVVCPSGYVNNCNGNGCCPESWLHDDYSDCEDETISNLFACNLSCYEQENCSDTEWHSGKPSSHIIDINHDSVEIDQNICHACDVTYSSDDDAMVACCDEGFLLYNVNCAYLERVGYNCAGCLCQGDLGDENDECPTGTVANCNQDSDIKCCQGDWVGDDICDDPSNRRSQFSRNGDVCDLTCYEEELNACGSVAEVTYKTTSPLSGFQFYIDGNVDVNLIRGGKAQEAGLHFSANLDLDRPIVIAYAFDLNSLVPPCNVDNGIDDSCILTNIFYENLSPNDDDDNCNIKISEATIVSKDAVGLIGGVDGCLEIVENCITDTDGNCITADVIVTTKTDPVYYDNPDADSESNIKHYQTVVYYDSNKDISGFEFQLNSLINLLSIQSLDASVFSIASSSTQILAFSWTSLLLPAGDGVLMVLYHSNELSEDNVPIESAIFVGEIQEINDGEDITYSAPAIIPEIKHDFIIDTTIQIENPSEKTSLFLLTGTNSQNSLSLNANKVSENLSALQFSIPLTTSSAKINNCISHHMRFICSASEHTVLFFSNTGDALISHISINKPQTLLTVEGEGLPNDTTGSDCIHNQLVINTNGKEVPTTWVCPNGLHDILYDPGCISENYDCAGICNGNTPVDVCGICGGPGKNEHGCCGGDDVKNLGCGCGNPEPACDGLCGSNVELDYCGVCGGENYLLQCNNECYVQGEERFVRDRNNVCCNERKIGFCNECYDDDDTTDIESIPDSFFIEFPGNDKCSCEVDENGDNLNCLANGDDLNLSICVDDAENQIRDSCGICGNKEISESPLNKCLKCSIDDGINDDGNCITCDVNQYLTNDGECKFCENGSTNLSGGGSSCSQCNVLASSVGDANSDGFTNIVDVMKLIFHNNVKSCNHECLDTYENTLDDNFCQANMMQFVNNGNDSNGDFSGKLDQHDLHGMIEKIVGSTLHKSADIYHGLKPIDISPTEGLSFANYESASKCYDNCSSSEDNAGFTHINGECKCLSSIDTENLVNDNSANTYVFK